jgi:hypothetical protein
LHCIFYSARPAKTNGRAIMSGLPLPHFIVCRTFN